MMRRVLYLCTILAIGFIYAAPVKADVGAGWVECEIISTQTWDTTRNDYRFALKLNDINGSFENTWIEVQREINISHFLAQALTAISAGKNVEVRIVQSGGSFYIDAMRLIN